MTYVATTIGNDDLAIGFVKVEINLNAVVSAAQRKMALDLASSAAALKDPDVQDVAESRARHAGSRFWNPQPRWIPAKPESMHHGENPELCGSSPQRFEGPVRREPFSCGRRS